jgi:lipopolysaccharide transport system ATP-binding protein
VKGEEGHVSEAVDIRRPLEVEMEYDVLRGGYPLMPFFEFFNTEGVRLFLTLEQDPAWRGRPRPAGRYRSAVRVPGNFLAEGTHFVEASLLTLRPRMLQFDEEVVVFEVVDSQAGDAARGDWTGNISGVVRPLLEWHTQQCAEGLPAAAGEAASR